MGQRLIDEAEARRRIIAFATGLHSEVLPIDTVMMLLTQAQTVDAVPVIRCFECKHGWTHPCGYVLCHRDGRNAYEMTFNLDSFCSYGERKEGADNG